MGEEEENSFKTYFSKMILILFSKSLKIIQLFKKGFADELGQGHTRNFRPFWLLQHYFQSAPAALGLDWMA